MPGVPPTGEQFEIADSGYRAVVTESGATLRVLEHRGRSLIDGFAVDDMPSGGRGQILAPWPNRIRDGRYDFGGAQHQLDLSEPARHNASHGLVRWVAWSVEEHTDASVSLVYRLMARTGYPWTVDLHVLYDLSAEGLTVTHTATNMSAAPAPYAFGAHPYLLASSSATIEHWELTMPAETQALVDERKLPIGSMPVADSDQDFRVARPLSGAVLDDAFGDLTHDEFEDGSARVSVTLRDPSANTGILLWGDRGVRWLQVYTADDSNRPRRSVAVEPMTAPPDAFRSGTDLVSLAAAGEPGDEHSVCWGLTALQPGSVG